MPLILGTNSIKDTGFDVANSLRFNSGSADYLNRTPSSASNRKTWTWSSWVKKVDNTTSRQFIFNADSSSQNTSIEFKDNAISVFDFNSGSYQWQVITSAIFRDNSAWMHICVAINTADGTASNRVKIYVNGSQITSFSTSNYPSLNYESKVNLNVDHRIGSISGSTTFDLDGYIAEAVLVDGSQLTPTSFGEFDEDSGIWKPIDVSGLTFGTNGFYLDFENSGSLGNDKSGNGNNFTVNNLTSIDQTTDTCTNNFCTLNPLVPTSSATFSEGNLKLVGSSSSAFNNRSQGTFGVQSGKWYFEVEFDSISATSPTIGIGRSDRSASDNPTVSNAGDVCIRADNEKYDEGSSSASYFSSSISAGDIIGVALDMDNGKVWFSKNGTFVGTVGSSGQAATFTVGSGVTITPTVRPTDGTLICNFGNSPVAILSGNTDGNGYGNFEYAVPSGYYSLNTKNLAEYG